jgi:hypothetical protein
LRTIHPSETDVQLGGRVRHARPTRHWNGAILHGLDLALPLVEDRFPVLTAELCGCAASWQHRDDRQRRQGSEPAKEAATVHSPARHAAYIAGHKSMTPNIAHND